MTKEYGKQVFEIMGNIHMLMHKIKPTVKVSRGEFMMLCRIEHFMEEQEKEAQEKEEQGNEEEEKVNLAPGVSISKINNIMKASKPATSKMLGNLEEKNYIQRIADKKDRRVVYIRLTNEGGMILKEAKAQFSQFADHVIGKLGEKDATELIRIFNKLYQILSDEMGNRKGHK